MKKLLAFAMMFLLIGTLAACGGDSEDQQAVDQAIGSLMIPQEMSEIRGNFEVPAQIQGLDVIWEVDRDDIIEFGNVVEGDAYPELEVIVHRPEPEEGDQDITLTATIIKGDAEGTREFDGRVRAQEESDVYTDFAELYDNASMNDLITAQGVVTGVFRAGFFLYDGEHHLGIYIPSGHDYELGDEVEVTGSYGRYNTLYQLGFVENTELISSGNDYSVEATEITLADFHDQDLSDPLIHGAHFTVTGRIEERGQYDNMSIVDLDDSDLYFMVYHESYDDSIDALEANLGEIVELTVIYYTNHSRDGVLVVFQGGEDDLGEVELGDEEQFNADVSQVDGSEYLTDGDDIDLPDEGSNDTQFTGWASDNTDLIADDGTFVSRPAQTTEVTLTATATLGSFEDTVTVTVRVVGTESLSVEDALAYADGEDVHVEGIVTAIDPYGDGFFMQDEDGPGIYVRLFSRDEEMFEDVQPGNKITVFGTLGRYTTHDNNERQLTDDKLLTSNDEGDHTVNIIDDMSDEDIVVGFNYYDEDGDADQPGGQTNLVKYRLEDITFDDLDEYGYIFIGEDEHGDNDRRLTLPLWHVEDFGVPGEDDFENGLEIEYMEFVVQRMHFGNLRLVVTDLQVATD